MPEAVNNPIIIKVVDCISDN